MKRLFHIAVMAVLVTLVTGCGGVHRYDARLVAADSLMWTAPDSVLATLTAIDSLTGEGNLAYRDLLMTQARYKCYADITASDDSAITRAIDYYRAHSSQREKLTRAYLYKGAVMEELGRVDSAMYYYKTAEATADPKDYPNLGQINIRIADLYREEYSQDSAALLRFKESIRYYSILADTNYIIYGLGAIGCIYGVTHPDSAKHYLESAIRLAQQYDPSLQYSHKSTLAGVYFYQNDYVEAKNTAMDILKNGRDDCGETQFYYFAALSNLKLGHLDSAKFILNITPQPVDAVDSMNYYNVLAEIANLENDHDSYKRYKERSHEITEQVLSNSKKGTIAIAESEFEKVHSQNTLKQKHKSSFLWLAGLCFLIIMVLSFTFYHHKHRYDRIIKDIKQQSANQLNDLTILNDNIENLKIQDNQLKGFITSHLALMREMIETCYHSPQSKLTEQVKKIVQFQHDNEQKWTQLYHYIDAEYNNLISKTRDNYPQLNDKDLMLIALTSIGFSYIQIAIIMGYSNATSVSTIKQRLAQKMHLDGSLNDYINSIVGA